MTEPTRKIARQATSAVAHISPEPDVRVRTLPPPAEGPSMLILASDGLWGLLADDEAAAIATAHADDPQAAADALMAEIAQRGGRDNASVIVAAWSGRA